MKGITYIILLFLLLNCLSDKELNHIEVAKLFTEAVYQNNFETASKYATKEAIENVKFYSQFIEDHENKNKYEFKFVKDTIRAHTAWIVYLNYQNEERSIKLKRRRRIWKVVNQELDEKDFFNQRNIFK